MSVEIKYKGNTIASASTDTTKTIKTSGKYCEADIEVINTQDGGITPSGSLSITDNGTYDVTQYAEALVNVSGGGGSLPSSISKIDGGTFTLSSSKSPDAYWIDHTLGKTPRGFMIWTETRPPCTDADALGFAFVVLSYDPGSGNQGYYMFNKLWREQPTSESQVPGWITAPTQYADSARLRVWASAAKYEAGVEYKWLAWA